MDLLQQYESIVNNSFDEVRTNPNLIMALLRFYSKLTGETPKLCEKCHLGYYNLIKSKDKDFILNFIHTMESKTNELNLDTLIYWKGAHYTAATLSDVTALEYLLATGDEKSFKTLPADYLELKQKSVIFGNEQKAEAVNETRRG